ncbi:hypothetical protein PRUB_b0928 [Pseudoalteromonas rubra]|uniref:Uncharacterized protein n=1 Tax=Pseudoalteromonas rubra TaxID=43658 RepID=A0A8T0C2T7_9GAMM|nr:hypothetical protein PRUB_b0928 [Pseudoalteromonas rubra]
MVKRVALFRAIKSFYTHLITYAVTTIFLFILSNIVSLG